MSGRDEWTVYVELGRAGVERARAVLERADRPELAPPVAVSVPLLTEPDTNERDGWKDC